MSSRLADRLAAARRRRFIGRTAELTLLESALTAEELPFFVLYVHGPGGLGKTSLLSQFARLAEQRQVPAYTLDARNIEPTPEAFAAGLCLAMGIDPTNSPADALPPGRGATSSWWTLTSCSRRWTGGCATSFCPSFQSGCWLFWPAATRRPQPGGPTRVGSPFCIRCPCATSARTKAVTI